MRRRVVCPRSHPASPYLRRLFGRLRYGSRYFPGGMPTGPLSPYPRRLRPHWAPRRGLAAPPGGPNPCLAATRGGAVFRVAAALRSPTFAGRPGGSSWAAAGLRGARLRCPLRPWRRIFASDAVVAPHLRFGTGSGAASPWLTLPWRPTSAPYRPATARSPLMPTRGTVPVPVPTRGGGVHFPSTRCSLRAQS